jgi:hypothetical protein
VAEHADVPPAISGPLGALTALTGSGIQKMGEDWFAKLAAKEGVRKATEVLEQYKQSGVLDAAKAAQTAHKEAGPAFAEQQGAQARASAEKATQFQRITEAHAAKWQDSEHTGADADREAVASGLGQSQTVQQGGEALQDAARSWKKDEFPQKLKDAEDKMYDGAVQIPKDAPGDLSNFRNSLTNSFYRAGELEPAAQQLRSRMPERLESALDDIALKQGLLPGEVPNATLSDMKKLRSILGDAMTSPKLSEGVDAGKMNELYRALSSDMEGAISNAAGPQGVAQFKKFNEEARRLYGLASGPVSKIISTTDKAGETILPGEAATNVLKGSDKDGSQLAQLGSEPTLKKGLNEVAASQLRTGKGVGVTQGDPDKFFTGLAPEAKTALLGDVNAGKMQDSIDRRMQADKAFEHMKNVSQDWSGTMKQSDAEARDAQARTRAEEGNRLAAEKKAAADQQTALKQGLTKAKATRNELMPPNQDILQWLYKMKGELGGFLGGGAAAQYHGLESMGMPGDWSGVTTPLAGAATALGVHALKNPIAVRNALQGYLATAPFRTPTNVPEQTP